MKIALCGPSGSGKTTLAKFLETHLGLEFLAGSSFSKLLSDSQKTKLRDMGYKETGHREVIQLSHSNPHFGRFFQNSVLYQRAELLRNNSDFITDRSPVDNLVYYLMQVAPTEVDPTKVVEFIESCLNSMDSLTHLVFVQVAPNQLSIETNGSRVDNLHFQRMVNAIFDHVLAQYIMPNFAGPILVLRTWDWEVRVKEATEFFSKNPL